ncbi:glycosyltransferase family 4 protein [Pauljensenia sp. UMB10120]|uniref:glycosyltransferase family 4 protein n=1 Tax=Pauljensenia sp. UMB10120 TaxID=3046356 RepID=UPI0025514F0E|nr:glycosyltransferase family 4 protein [Pauljensenia sp. UMB10120]MDK6242366.1 glycosyltransferase family 4 protein [Pauljensenia sp. UMB10120]
MKVALVSDCYPPRLGGIETQVAGLARALSAAGHDVTVITATPLGSERGDHTSVEDGVHVRRLTMRLPWDIPINPLARATLTRALPTFDVVHIHTGVVSPFARMATNICARHEIACVVTWHCMLDDQRLWYGWANPLDDWQRAGIVLSAVSSSAARAVERCARGPVSVRILPNFITAEPWETTRVSHAAHAGLLQAERARGRAAMPVPLPSSRPSRPLRAVTATRLAPRKRITQLVECVRAARSRGADIELNVYGDGPMRSSLERCTAGSGFIHWCGRKTAHELADAYRDADVFVSPVVHEAFGIAALEAHASGLPVIYRSGNGIADFCTDGVDGLAAASDGEMARALFTLATRPEQLAELRRAATSESTPLTWERGARVVTDLYQDVRSNHHSCR